MIKLENELVHHRLTVTLTLQGLLFAGISFCTNALLGTSPISESSDIQLLFWIMSGISAVGLWSSITVTTGIRAALRQIMAASLWLKTVTINECPFFLKCLPHPPIVGNQSKYSIFHIPIGTDTPYSNYYYPCSHDADTGKSSCRYNNDCTSDTCKRFFEQINNTKSINTSAHKLLDIISVTWITIIIFTLNKFKHIDIDHMLRTAKDTIDILAEHYK